MINPGGPVNVADWTPGKSEEAHSQGGDRRGASRGQSDAIDSEGRRARSLYCNVDIDQPRCYSSSKRATTIGDFK